MIQITPIFSEFINFARSKGVNFGAHNDFHIPFSAIGELLIKLNELAKNQQKTETKKALFKTISMLESAQRIKSGLFSFCD